MGGLCRGDTEDPRVMDGVGTLVISTQVVRLSIEMEKSRLNGGMKAGIQSLFWNTVSF